MQIIFKLQVEIILTRKDIVSPLSRGAVLSRHAIAINAR
jgi:hypothetical protein